MTTITTYAPEPGDDYPERAGARVRVRDYDEVSMTSRVIFEGDGMSAVVRAKRLASREVSVEELHAHWAAGGWTWLEECRVLRDAGLITECELEFGPHTEHADCAWLLDEMTHGADRAADAADDLARAYNREAEEQMLGRPLFPNEY